MEESRKEERTVRDMKKLWKERRERQKGREACQCIISPKKYSNTDLPDFTA